MDLQAASTTRAERRPPPRVIIPEKDQDIVGPPIFEVATTSVEPKRWSAFVLNMQQRYRRWRADLVKRTETTLVAVADDYLERYEGERDPATGEVTNSYFQRLQRSLATIRSSVTLQGAMELGARTALAPLEFGTQMAFKQFGVDIAIRQAEFTELGKKYESRGGIAAVEAQALTFANQVRQEFERLAAAAKELPGGKPEDREPFRQQRIAEAVAYAESLLKPIAFEDASAKQRILADLRTYADTVMFDPQRSALLQRWDRLGRGHRGAIQDLVTRQIDIYQKRRARNLAIFTTTARWLTFGAESFIVQKIGSASHSVTANYDKLLSHVPAEQRTGIERMKTLAGAVTESLKQFALVDTWRAAREQVSGVDKLVDELMAVKNFDVDKLHQQLFDKYKSQLTDEQINTDWLYGQLEIVADERKNHRQALTELIRYRLEKVHRTMVKATARQMEYVYNQYNANVTTLSILADIDMTVNRALHAREAIGVTLAQLSGEHIPPTIMLQEAEALDAIEEPQYHGFKAVMQAVVAEQETVSAGTVEHTAEALPQPEFVAAAEVPDQTFEQLYTVLSGDALEKIARIHLAAYRLHFNDPDMTVYEVQQHIQSDNHIANVNSLQVGQQLQVYAELSTVEMQPTQLSDTTTAVAPTVIETGPSWQETVSAAKTVDQRGPEMPAGYLATVDRYTLEHNELPVGEYRIVLGERLGKAGGRMPVHYSDVLAITIESDGTTWARSLREPAADRQPLADALVEHPQPIVRVFQLTGEPPELHTETLRPNSWSLYHRALIEYLQDHPKRVVAKDGTYCAKDAAGRLSLFAPELAADVGIDLRDGEGHVTGVTAHAPMFGAAIESAGGRTVVSLENYFSVQAGRASPQASLDQPSNEYRTAVEVWLREAAASPLREATMLYHGTHIHSIIAANQELGGQPNSHVVTLLGEKELTNTIEREQTVAQHLQRDYHISPTDLQTRGWMFATLGIEVNGERITDQTDWQNRTVQPGDQVTVHDVALNHRFNGDRRGTLVTMMVDTGAFSPVSILEPNAKIVNEALAYNGATPDYVVDTFVEVQTGDTLEAAFARVHLPRDLWTANAFMLRTRGINPDHVEPGMLLPIYNEVELREHIDEIYEREERRLVTVLTDQSAIADSLQAVPADRATVGDQLTEHGEIAAELYGVTYHHIVRPGESIDAIVRKFYDRSHYSAKEWSWLRSQLADRMQIPHDERPMPGDEYTTPYTVDEYHLTADRTLTVTHDQLAQLDLSILDQRANERTYVPDMLPIATTAGVETVPVPAQVQTLIDRVMSAHPEYDQSLRHVMALVFANEGLREGAEKNYVSQAMTWVDDHLAQPMFKELEQSFSYEDQLIAWLTHGPYNALRDDAIAISEYASSRQLLKDVAWWIHDTPTANALLATSLHTLQSEELRQVVPTSVQDLYDDAVGTVTRQLEKIAGVSSAGLFQFRANNVVSETGDGPNGTAALTGRVMTHDQFERELRADPLLNTTAAAELLHDNMGVLRTYTEAFGDPLADDEKATVLAAINSYNGGPLKTVVGGLQTSFLQLERAWHIDTPLNDASGRDITATRQAFVELCLKLQSQGKMDLSEDQILRDSQLLGSHTVAFLRSDSLQALKAVYPETTGQAMTILPRQEQLADPHVQYGNYAYLATRGGALEHVLSYSQASRLASKPVESGVTLADAG